MLVEGTVQLELIEGTVQVVLIGGTVQLVLEGTDTGSPCSPKPVHPHPKIVASIGNRPRCTSLLCARTNVPLDRWNEL